MANAPILWVEPERFTSGDTLIYNRCLRNYLPSNGWKIKLTVSAQRPNAAEDIFQVDSTPDQTNAYHQFNVPNFLGDFDEGTYIFSEEVVNVNGEKHQIFLNSEFIVGPQLNQGTATGPNLTVAQRMIAIVSSTLEELYAQKFNSTDVQNNSFVLQKTTEAETSLNYWIERRNQEIQQENIRNGRPSGATSMPVFWIG